MTASDQPTILERALHRRIGGSSHLGNLSDLKNDPAFDDAAFSAFALMPVERIRDKTVADIFGVIAGDEKRGCPVIDKRGIASANDHGVLPKTEGSCHRSSNSRNPNAIPAAAFASPERGLTVSCETDQRSSFVVINGKTAMRWQFMPVKHHDNSNSAASPSSSAADRGASEFPVADAPHAFFSEWLNCFLPLVMGTHEETWPGSVHRAHSPALSRSHEGHA